MTKDQIFQLYKRVQRKDRNAEQQLIAEHRRMFPDSWLHRGQELVPGGSEHYRQNLHTVYLHLTR